MAFKPRSWSEEFSRITYSHSGLELLHEMYESNWKNMVANIGSRKYIRRERKLNALEIKIRKHLGIYAEVPPLSENERLAKKYTKANLIQILNNFFLTKAVSCDILSDKVGEEILTGEVTNVSG